MFSAMFRCLVLWVCCRHSQACVLDLHLMWGASTKWRMSRIIFTLPYICRSDEHDTKGRFLFNNGLCQCHFTDCSHDVLVLLFYNNPAVEVSSRQRVSLTSSFVEDNHLLLLPLWVWLQLWLTLPIPLLISKRSGCNGGACSSYQLSCQSNELSC